MTNEIKRVYTYNGGVTTVLKTPLEITDTTAFYRIGQSPRVWIGSTFKVFADAAGTVQYVLGVDYVLDQHYVDIEMSKQVGEACFSYLKFTKEARTIYVDMDVVGSHVDGTIINELIETSESHAATLSDHAGQFTAINNKNNEQDLRLSAAESENNTQNSRLDELEEFVGDGGINAYDDKATIANNDVFLIEDSEDEYSKKKITASQIVAAGGGGGDVYGPASSVSDDIALFDGVTGKLLKDSGIKIETTLSSASDINVPTSKAVSDFILSYVFPVGSFYVQYPNENSDTDATAFPSSLRPATLFGGTWEEQWSTEAVFFRTRGGPVDAETDNRTNGLQTDQLQNVSGSFPVPMRVNGGEGTTSGCFISTVPGNIKNATQTDVTTGRLIEFSLSETGRAGNETRPRNRLMKVWKRTA